MGKIMKIEREDLAKMTLPYLKSLDHETLVDISFELRNVVIDLLERLDMNSKNSSKPPSSDDPYKKKPKDQESKKSDDEDKKDEDKDLLSVKVIDPMFSKDEIMHV